MQCTSIATAGTARAITLLGLQLVAFEFAPAQGKVYLHETFDSADAASLAGWTLSKASKGDSKYDGVWKVVEVDEPTDTSSGNSALVATEANHHYAISTPLSTPFSFGSSPFVLQYSVRFQEPMTCGGSYMKLLAASPDLDLTDVKDDTLYSILFGPDKCGSDAHLRFIFNFKNPTTGNFREVHAKRITTAQQTLYSDKMTHLVTLTLQPDNTFSILIDRQPAMSGRLGSADEFDPPLHPPKTLDDPDDVKPADWVDEKEIDDPEDIMPDSWVTEATIDDPSATKPEDWDDDMDGEWEPPSIKNPEYKGDFKAKQIDNPEYVGVWKPKQLENPEFFKEDDPFHKLLDVSAISFELWTITRGTAYDDIILTDNEEEAATAAEAWKLRKEAEELREGSSTYFFDTLKALYDQAQEQPLMWVLYFLMIALPVYFLFFTGPTSTSAETTDAQQNSDSAANSDDENDSDSDDDNVANVDAEEERDSNVDSDE